MSAFGGMQSRRNELWRAIAVLLLLVLGLASCSTSTGSSRSGSSASSVFTWAQSTGPFVENFNPFSLTHVGGGDGLVYEPLMMPDIHTDSERPWLATSYSWSDGGRTLTLDLRRGVRWSNGRPFTAEDVAFTFELLKKFPELNLDAIPLASAAATNATTALLHFTGPAYQFFDDVVNTVIKPKFIFDKVTNPATFVLKHPIGTGPYILKSFSTQAITYVKNSRYWQADKVRIPVIRHLAFDSQASLLEALEAGKVTLANILMPRTEQARVEAAHPFLHFYEAPTVMTPLLLNLTVYPFDLVAVRKAISSALNRKELTEVAVGGVYYPATSPTGIDALTDAGKIAPQFRSLQFTPSASAAKKLLEDAGFRLAANGIFLTPRGKPFSFDLLIPSTFVNYLALAESMVGELRAAGIELHIKTETATAYNEDVRLGDYQAAFAPELTEGSPEATFEAYLDTNAYKPVGTPTDVDLERLEDPAVGKLVDAYLGSAPGSALHANLRAQLEHYMVKQMPVIPVFINADMGDYNTQSFTGWPSPSNPYADPAPLRFNLEEFLTHLVPRSEK